MSKWTWVANITAGVLLGGSLVYFNFIDKPPVSLVKVGEECPNFYARPYNVNEDTFTSSNDVFTLVKQRGKVCVVNFWETWCVACIKELPDFDRIQVEYADEVEVVALVGSTTTMGDGAKWLTNKQWLEKYPEGETDWADFSLTVAYLPANECKKLGVTKMLPRTIVVDQEGVVVYEANASMHYEQLKEIIDGIV